MTRRSIDVAVIGGGPAGLSTALRLQQLGLEVAVIERTTYETIRIGEHLTTDAYEALRELGVLDVVLADGHFDSPGIRSIWGDSRAREIPAFWRPAGAGLHLDRPRFDRTLARQVESRGSEVVVGCRITKVERASCAWRLDLTALRGDDVIEARFLVDATGRPAWLARKLGACRLRRDCLTGFAAVSSWEDDPVLPLVEAVERGWWYSAMLPGGELVAIYFTDADLRMPGLDPSSFWQESLRTGVETTQRLGAAAAQVKPRGIPAQSQRLARPLGDGWLAVGDAAMAFDPLSSGGIAKGLRGGIEGAEAVCSLLAGDLELAVAYAGDHAAAFDDYLKVRRRYYRMEQRWPDSCFWARRHRLVDSSRPIWLAPGAALRSTADVERFDSSLQGVAPDVDGESIARLAGRPILARTLAAGIRQATHYEDEEILTVLQALVEDGCLGESEAESGASLRNQAVP